ncbi:translocation protein TolB [Aneurinibacillus uraniidurans]|uniref:translocation protein TolB n=1 Tax=Aneurinibacillus uraniidurans TaxID=2966586 RepID=UPI002348F1CC|nr:translocation protein TolB [Aneurinibacillus sp. B1]WCN36528.1 translocation protein TolB [Aneurinibacillus sp. B1]
MLLRALLLFCLLLVSVPTSSAADSASLSAAFIRDGFVWIKQGTTEWKISQGQPCTSPCWSPDGRWVAYLQGTSKQQLYVYDTKTKRTHTVYSGGASQIAWAPDHNTLAFQIGGVLNVSDITPDGPTPFRNVALAVDNYSWQPDGSGFLVSSAACLTPAGWTNPKLYTVPTDAKLDPKKVQLLYTLPNEISKDGATIQAIGTSSFKWSPDHSWIAFIVSPTASLSMDSDMLCIVSADGRTFRVIGEMLNSDLWFAWAPSENRLAYIAGGGRYAFENKKLRLSSPTAVPSAPLTPDGYVDRDLTWVSNTHLVVSRAKESKLFASTSPPPSRLYGVTIPGGVARALTDTPMNGASDIAPVYLPRSNQLAWQRARGTEADVWLSRPDGSVPRIWINRIDAAPSYYGRSRSDDVLSLYERTEQAEQSTFLLP